MVWPFRSHSGSLARPRHEAFGTRVTRVLRRAGWVCLSLAVLTVIGFSARFIHQFVFQSGYFKIASIRVTGASPVLEDAARAFIQAQINSLDEQNLFKFDNHYTVEKLGDLPRAKSVRVSKVFPQSLEVEFTEREPLMVANLDRPYLIDEDGVLMDAIGPARIRQTGLPVLTGIKKDGHTLGNRIHQDNIKQILATVKLLHGNDPDLYRRIVEWNVNSQQEITAILDTHTEVRFGEELRSDLLAKLSGALADAQLRPQLEKATYVDLRMEKQIVLR